jgi:hypothetical protein
MFRLKDQVQADHALQGLISSNPGQMDGNGLRKPALLGFAFTPAEAHQAAGSEAAPSSDAVPWLHHTIVNMLFVIVGRLLKMANMAVVPPAALPLLSYVRLPVSGA